MPGTTPNRAYPYPVPGDAINVPRDVGALAMALDADLAANLGVPWIALPLIDGWFYDDDEGLGPPQYRKVGDMVQVRGAMRRPTGMADLSANNFATLPTGYRPPYNLNPPVSVAHTSNTYHVTTNLGVFTTGNLAVFVIPGTSPHLDTVFSFEFSVLP